MSIGTPALGESIAVEVTEGMAECLDVVGASVGWKTGGMTTEDTVDAISVGMPLGQ